MRVHSSQNRLMAALLIATAAVMALGTQAEAAKRKVLAEGFTAKS